MNKFIKEELDKLNLDIEYNNSTTDIFIPKQVQLVISDNSVGRCYMVQLDDYLIHPYDGFDLHKNWNNNIVPSDEYMNCEVLQVMGKMIKVNGSGCTKHGEPLSSSWEGWLPVKSIKIIKEI